MKVSLMDRPVMEWLFQRSSKQATRVPQFSPTTNPLLILDIGLQLAKERKYRVQSKVRRLMAKKSHVQRDYLWPSPAHMEVHCFYHLKFPGEPVWKGK